MIGFDRQRKLLWAAFGLLIVALTLTGCRDPQDEAQKRFNANVQAEQDRQTAVNGEAAQALDDTMKSWIGADKAKLLRVWGPPISTFEDGKGGQIFTYREDYVLPSIPSMNLPDQNLTSTRLFYVNQGGTVYDYNWKGLHW